MQFHEFIAKAAPEIGGLGLQQELDQIAAAIDREGGFAKVIEKDDPTLSKIPAGYFLKLSLLHRSFKKWRAAAADLRRRLTQDRSVMPEGALFLTWTTHQLNALERVLKMCPRSGHPDHDAWAAAVAAHVELWTRCVDLALQSSVVVCQKPQKPKHDMSEYAHLAGKTNVSDLRGYRWLAMRRAQRGNTVEIILQHPGEDFLTQAKALLPRLGICAAERGALPVLEEIVMNDITPVVLRLLDRKAEEEALGTAATSFESLLSSPPLKAGRVLSVFVGSEKGPIGLATLDGDGNLDTHLEVPHRKGWEENVKQFVSSDRPEVGVLPASAPDKERLQAVEMILSDLPVVRIHPAAVSEARKDLGHSPSVSSALVLAQRALRPFEAWTQVDPVLLGLGEYPTDLDQELLRQVLDETRALVGFKKRNGARKPVPARPEAQRIKAPARMNPIIKSVKDLKPGMPVEGVVTNLTRFGAFVNIGVGGEALIHISQVSDQFVDDPAKVLQVGQKVAARVLEVDPERKAIKLTLKSQHQERRDDRPRQRKTESGSAAKERALQDLHKLFKK